CETLPVGGAPERTELGKDLFVTCPCCGAEGSREERNPERNEHARDPQRAGGRCFPEFHHDGRAHQERAPLHRSVRRSSACTALKNRRSRSGSSGSSSPRSRP